MAMCNSQIDDYSNSSYILNTISYFLLSIFNVLAS